MNKQKFEKLDKVKELLDELKMTDLSRRKFRGLI